MTMNQQEKTAYPEHRKFLEEEAAFLLSPKREKFLFENDFDRKSVCASTLPVVTYHTTPRRTQNDFIMRIIVDSHSVTELRQLILKTYGDLVLFIRVKPIDNARKMKVWLCLSKSSVDTVISNIMHTLPQAEFGKVTPLLPF